MTEARQTAKQPSASFFDFFDRCDARCSEHAGEAAEAALKLCHGFAGLVIRRFQSAVDRRENQILKHFHVFRIHHFRINRNLLELTGCCIF